MIDHRKIQQKILHLIRSGIARKFGIVFTVNWINNILRFLLGIYIVKVFGAQGKGAYFLVQAGASVIAVLMSLGVTNSLVYHLQKKMITQKRVLRIMLVSAVLVALATALMQTLFGAAAWKLFLKDVPFNWKWGIIVVAYVPVFHYTLFLRSHLLACRSTTSYFVLTSVSQFCVILTTIAMTIQGSFPLETVLLATICIEAMLAFILLVGMYRAGNELGEPTGENVSFSELISFGLRGHAGTVGNNLANRCDAFLLAAFTSTEIVGYYSVAKFFYQAMISVPQALNGLLLGYFCDRSKNDAVSLNRKLCLRVCALMLVLAAIGLVAGGPFILAVYGPDFSVAVLPLQILLGSAVLVGAYSPCLPLFLSRGRPGIVSIVGINGGAFRVGLAFVLVAQYSIVGAAVASLATSFLTMLLCFYFYNKLAGEPENDAIPNVRNAQHI